MGFVGGGASRARCGPLLPHPRHDHHPRALPGRIVVVADAELAAIAGRSHLGPESATLRRQTSPHRTDDVTDRQCLSGEIVMINNPFGKLETFERWLIGLASCWAVVWVIDSISSSGWLPRVDCLVDLAILAAGVLLIGLSVGFLIVRFYHRQFSLGAVVAVLMMLLALFVSRKIPNKPTQICHIPDSTITIRFYYHDSIGGATGSDRFSVTYQDEIVPEKGIFYAYSSPFITSVTCRKDGVMLNQLQEKPIFLPLLWIQEDLLEHPLRFYKGRLETLEYADDVRGWASTFIPTPTPTSP